MPPITHSGPSPHNRGFSANNSAKGRTLLLAAVCASLTPSASAFTVGPIRRPAHAARIPKSSQNESSLALSSSSSNNGPYFFTAPPQSLDDDVKPETKIETEPQRMAPIDSGLISAEQLELRGMGVVTTDHVFLPTAVAPPVMDVDGNGTGALMKRSRAAGGVDPPLMTTNPSLAFPIDSGKEGMQARDTRAKTRQSSNDGIIDRAQPKTRLVRYSLPSSDDLERTQEPTKTKLVLAPASGKDGTSSELAKPQSHKRQPQLQPPKTRLVRYNGPDIEASTDYDGTELPSVKKKLDRQLILKRATLVRYEGESQQEHLEAVVPDCDISNDDENCKSGTEEDHQKGRKTLVEDVGYANQYKGPTDFNLARKTGLSVNKPISLWVERDKFL